MAVAISTAICLPLAFVVDGCGHAGRKEGLKTGAAVIVYEQGSIVPGYHGVVGKPNEEIYLEVGDQGVFLEAGHKNGPAGSTPTCRVLMTTGQYRGEYVFLRPENVVASP